MVPARVLLLKGYILIAYILCFHVIFLSKHKLFIHVGFFSFKTDTKYYQRKIMQLVDQ